MVVGDIKQQLLDILMEWGPETYQEQAERIDALYEQHFIDKHCKAVDSVKRCGTSRLQLSGDLKDIVYREDAQQAIRESKGGT